MGAGNFITVCCISCSTAARRGSVWVHSTCTCRALTRADMRGEAQQTDRRTRQSATYSHRPTLTSCKQDAYSRRISNSPDHKEKSNTR
eukprot:jgi/Chrzof1/4761/Cz14g25090.t1